MKNLNGNRIKSPIAVYPIIFKFKKEGIDITMTEEIFNTCESLDLDTSYQYKLTRPSNPIIFNFEEETLNTLKNGKIVHTCSFETNMNYKLRNLTTPHEHELIRPSNPIPFNHM